MNILPTPVQRTSIYVDGFNFYYGAVKGTPHKWLNFMTLFRDLLRPTNDIRKIRYFTAMISGKIDPTGPDRQQTYLRALRTIPGIEIHKGNFLVSQKWAPLTDPAGYQFRPAPALVSIQRTEEKGSDVNLATWLVRDVATFCRFVTPGRLAAAQFPDVIPGTTIRKPERWTTR